MTIYEKSAAIHGLVSSCLAGITHGYNLISNSIDFESKIVHKVITAVLLGNVNTS